MYIDDCQHAFEELAHTVLPHHMERLKQALSQLKPMSHFAEEGRGTIFRDVHERLSLSTGRNGQ